MHTMQACRLSFLSLLTVFGLASAQTPAVDATDLSIWPPCAQRCISQGFGASSSCGSLSNVECVCNNPDFTAPIGECEQSTCTLSERTEIQELSAVLCAPVGGLNPAISRAASNFWATYTNTLPSTISLVAPATATPTVDLLDISNYPPCADICLNQTLDICSTPDPTCLCGPQYRSVGAACNLRECNTEDFRTIQDLSILLCGPLYASNSALSASVGSAIALATATVASSISSSVSASAPGAALPTGSGSSNASFTGTGVIPAPSPFTGAAGRLGAGGLAVVVGMLLGFVGVVAIAL